jgi:uncharacterized protein (DUF433 family)
MSRYISRSEDVMGGLPCFSGIRVPIQNLFDYLETASSRDDFVKDFPTVSFEAVVAVLKEAKRGDVWTFGKTFAVRVE